MNDEKRLDIIKKHSLASAIYINSRNIDYLKDSNIK